MSVQMLAMKLVNFSICLYLDGIRDGKVDFYDVNVKTKLCLCRWSFHLNNADNGLSFGFPHSLTYDFCVAKNEPGYCVLRTPYLKNIASLRLVATANMNRFGNYGNP